MVKVVRVNGLPVAEKEEEDEDEDEEEEEDDDVDKDNYQPTADTDSESDAAEDDYDYSVDGEQPASNGCQRPSNGRRSDLLAGIKSQFALGMSREEMLTHKKRGVLHAENSFMKKIPSPGEFLDEENSSMRKLLAGENSHMRKISL